MSTPHNAACLGDFAKTVLMPGDPLRAKFIAENFLQNVRQVTAVRGMLGYTGTHAGVPVSVMGSGMGMPSIGIYSYELYTEYQVENIIRVGSAGGYSPQLQVRDVVLATGAYSESSFAKTQNGFCGDVTLPSETLCTALRKSAQAQQLPLAEGVVHSSDVFYRAQPAGAQTPYWQTLYAEKGCVAVEMESFALFHNARATGKRAACLVTISDSFVTGEALTATQREQSFADMVRIALGAVQE